MDDEEKQATPSVVYAIPQAMGPYKPDEIDLRELWRTLMRRKFVVLITAVLVVLASLVYVFMVSPVYEAKAVLNIGNYSGFDTNGVIQKMLIEDVNDLSAYINFNHAASSSVLNENASYLSVTASGSNKTESEKTLMVAVNDVLAKHNRFYDSAVESSQTKIELLENQINHYSNEILPGMRSELKSLQTLQLKRLDDKVADSALGLDTDYYLSQIISTKTSGISELVDFTIPNLSLRIMNLQKILEEPYLKKTALVNGISAASRPVKPKKKQILAVSLVAGFMLGVFLVFLLEFLRDVKKDDESEL